LGTSSVADRVVTALASQQAGALFEMPVMVAGTTFVTLTVAVPEHPNEVVATTV
jgi:hypothetical protein